MANYRRRMLWPSILSDPHIQKLTIPARWLFVCHILTADDEGRGDLIAEDWKSAAFPLDPEITEEVIEGVLLPELWSPKKKKKNPLVARYSAGGLEYWFLPKWSDYQRIDRPTRSKLPDPGAGQLSGPRPVNGGASPSFQQWDMVAAMATERGITLAKLASDMKIEGGVDGIRKEHISKIRRRLESIKTGDSGDAERRRIAEAVREIGVAVQLGNLAAAAVKIEAVASGDWGKVRAGLLRYNSNFSGKTKEALFESIREFSE